MMVAPLHRLSGISSLCAWILLSGCVSVPHGPDYLPEYARTHPREAARINVQNDAMDFLSLSFEFPALGAKVILGPLEAGLFVNGARARGTTIAGSGGGIRSGYTTYQSVENVFLLTWINDGTKFSGEDGAYLRKDLYNTRDYTFGRLGGEVGACLGIRFEINPLELVDFFTSLFGFDLLEDDAAAPFKDPLSVTHFFYGGRGWTEIPGGFNIYRNLQFLDLSRNRLKSIPPEFADLPHLKYLNLSSNQIQLLPEQFSRLESLEKLSLRENALRNPGSSLCGLRNLQELDLANNQMEKFPEVNCLENLKKLDLSYNPIRTIPDSISQMKSLEELHMFFTALESLPEAIGQLAELRVLDIQTRGEGVPPVDSIRKLKKLRRVKISRKFTNGLPDQASRDRLRAAWRNVLPPDCTFSDF